VPQSRFRKTHPDRRIHYPSDKKKLAVTAYLVSVLPKGATSHMISTKAKIRSQDGTEFREFLNGLERIGWVKKEESVSVGGYDNFFATEKGRDALNKAKELAREEHPLGALEAFEDIQDF